MASLLQTIFDNRHYTPDFFNTINDTSHPKLRGSDEYTSRLYKAYVDGSAITLLCDFDCDGAMAATVNFLGLHTLGFKNVNLYFPNPDEGYGFDAATIDDLMMHYPETDIIITADTGIKEFKGIEYAVSLGIDVIVTDHHPGTAQSCLDAGAVLAVDPMAAEDDYPHKSICGAMVAWELLMDYTAVCFPGDNRMHDLMSRILIFAGIGTFSDNMELTHESRMAGNFAITSFKYFYDVIKKSVPSDIIYSSFEMDIKPHIPSFGGDEYYEQVMRNAFHVLYLLMKSGNVRTKYDVNENFFGFTIAPMVNSVKRMSGRTELSYALFLCNDDNALETAVMPYLMKLNRERKAMVAKVMDKILSADQPYAPYIFFTDANQGLYGLIASKLVDMFDVPVLVLDIASDGTSAGSGRSPAWFKFRSIMMPILKSQARILGHEFAFGFQTMTDNIPSVFQLIQTAVGNVRQYLPESDAAPYDASIANTNAATYDFSTDNVSVFWQYLDDKAAFGSFGNGVPRPVIRFDIYGGTVSFMGSKKQHVKIETDDGFEILLWNMTDKFTEVIAPEDDSDDVVSNQYRCVSGYITVYGDFSASSFMGNTSVNFVGSSVAFTDTTFMNNNMFTDAQAVTIA